MSYRIGVDIGGTFTDCAVLDERGRRTASKALTTPKALERGVLDSLAVNARGRDLTLGELLRDTEMFVHSTTQATNALLLRNGAKTGLITTKGHEDALFIGRVYAKMAGLPERELVRSANLAKPRPIVPRELVRGVTERIDRDGEVIVAIDADEVAAAIDDLVAAGVEAIAVSLLWSFVNPAHEQRVKALLEERAGALFASFSHEVAPRMGEYERTATTAVNAYVGPRVIGYLMELERRLREEGLRRPMLVMQAGGGLTSTGDAAGKPIVTLDSGPTGGILGGRQLGRLYGEENLICTDVGGTSFDVGLVLDGEIPLDDEPVVDQYSLRFPKILVRSIGSGGGSIAWLDEHGLLRVGPQSAGSRPGPVCYGLGGTEPTVTDVDLVLGYLQPDAFLGGRMRLDRDLALTALAALGRPLGMEAEEVAIGVGRIINAQMADLILKSTIERGIDPRRCMMLAYGGAGPTHAVFYGHEVGTKAILVPAVSTVFSAAGILDCDIAHHAELSRRVVSPYDEDDLAGIGARFAALEESVLEQFAREEIGAEEVSLARTLGVRFRQQVHTLQVPVDGGEFDRHAAERLVADFAARYADTYGAGAVLSSRETEVELHRVVGTRRSARVEPARSPDAGADASAALNGSRRAYFEGHGFVAADVYDGERLAAGNVAAGPALIGRMGDSVVVPPGHRATVDPYRTIRIDAVAPAPADTERDSTVGAAR